MLCFFSAVFQDDEVFRLIADILPGEAEVAAEAHRRVYKHVLEENGPYIVLYRYTHDTRIKKYIISFSPIIWFDRIRGKKGDTSLIDENDVIKATPNLILVLWKLEIEISNERAGFIIPIPSQHPLVGRR